VDFIGRVQNPERGLFSDVPSSFFTTPRDRAFIVARALARTTGVTDLPTGSRECGALVCIGATTVMPALPTHFNAFLLAEIGDDGSGLALNLLSAFARRDLDPWQQAEHLSCSSKSRGSAR
jgi:hypothetical protein